MAAESAKLIIEVTAGLIPGKDPDPEFTRRYALTSAEWAAAEEAETQGPVLAEISGRAAGYAWLLQMQPDRLNWVRTEWVWL